MKPGLLYILLVSFIFLLALSKPSDHKPVNYHFSTYQSIAKNNSDALVIPGINVSPKQYFIELNFLRLQYESLFKNGTNCRTDLNPTFIKLYLTNILNKTLIKQYPILHVVRSFNDIDEHHNLS